MSPASVTLKPAFSKAAVIDEHQFSIADSEKQAHNARFFSQGFLTKRSSLNASAFI